jgi:hypothetical protein
MDRLESVQDVDSSHDSITFWGFPETGNLWTITFNSQIDTVEGSEGHYFSQKTETVDGKAQTTALPIKMWINYMKGSKVEYESPYSTNDYDMDITLKQRGRTLNLPANTKVEDTSITKTQSVS